MILILCPTDIMGSGHAISRLRYVDGSLLYMKSPDTHEQEMSQLSFDHLLNLSLAFHTRRKTGEVLRILDRGAAINHILEVTYPSDVAGDCSDVLSRL